MDKILELTGITKKFVGLVALNDINLTVDKNEILGIIGPNGAGKSTLFAVIAGYLKPDVGKILYNNHDITNHPTHEIARMGLCRTFQIAKPFSGMTVLENVMVGAFRKTNDVKRARELAFEVLKFCEIDSKAHLLGKELTVANKKRLEIAKVLATDPQVLLLDEVMAGLNPTEVKKAVDLLFKIHERGVTLLIIEHVMEVIMPISDRVVVLDYGKKIADSDPQTAVKNPDVINAYFGS
jgi:branched-chain amino acid transport system ATP-binding protein